jgi:hypothetical protein
MFDQIRDHLLAQLHLDQYVPAGGEPTPETTVAAGLAPEPFMLALQRSDIDITGWLKALLGGGTPNAVHRVLAQLSQAGAAVWTVNFDALIEREEEGGLPLGVWPDPPPDGVALLKPHGTLGGKLIVTSEQVLQGLEPWWLERLRRDVAGRVAVFIGYSGRDLDFRPVWDDVLSTATEVLWFDAPPVNGWSRHEQDRKRRMLPSVHAAGRLRFPEHPEDVPGSANPSWVFVQWAREAGLARVDDGDVDALNGQTADVDWPGLVGADSLATARVRELLGDTGGAARTYWQGLRQGPRRADAARRLLSLTLNHGGRPVATALSVARLLPPIGPLRGRRDALTRKRVSILFNVGDHQAVLRNTRSLAADSVSTLLVLRAGSLRMTGDLDMAAAAAARALERARAERHNIRVANAAFQEAFALIWAGRLVEAETAIEDRLRPYATVAASRWVAWADWLDATLRIHHDDPSGALRLLEQSGARFASEGLVDGVVSVDLVRVTALRQTDDRQELQQALSKVKVLMKAGGGTYYSKGHRFTQEALALEEAEIARCQAHDPAAAERHLLFVVGSRYPLHVALGHLGLAAIEIERQGTASHAHEAAAIGKRIKARGITEFAEGLVELAGRPDPTPPAGLFFP